MTRFLSRVLDDPQCGTFNGETKRLFTYHQATKHTYWSVRTSAHYLDWINQPNPFRTYEGALLSVLPPDPGFPGVGAFATMGELGRMARSSDETGDEASELIKRDATWLSQLLWHSMAISAWKKVPRTGSRYSLRVNPSSGNLHPTETYLALHGLVGLEDGLYHYRADRHALELLRPGVGTGPIARALDLPWAAESPLIVALTSIFWREAWKYRDRAYRYCCHDLGHAMMSLLLAARALGLPGGAITHFSDSRLTHALGLTGGDEAPMAFLVFPPKSSSEQLVVPLQETFAGVPNELSAEEVPYELLLEIHRSTILPDPAGPPPRPHSANAAPSDERSREPARDGSMKNVARRRRSALDFDARSQPMDRCEVEQLLDFATRDWPADWRGTFGGEAGAIGTGADFVTLYAYVHRVRECEPGVYRWNGGSCRLEQLHRSNVERVAAFLSLEQTLAGNACFAISMVADLAMAAQVFGNRGYRYVHFEAGAIGQKLYVGAEALGWNATGIGAFYDDDVHRYLGFLEETDSSVDASVDAAEQAALIMLGSPASRSATAQGADSSPGPSRKRRVHKGEAASCAETSQFSQQVIYHFAIGRAIPDPRLEA